ncbi:type VI secretion protein [Burkholderia lata]|uniref:Type VI secretion protein n=1 Tax=Burkholderia lata (strain ATCC 17760 / DSM 23089 / LMG 22485 / NCIMB 9086 / R18194 / 383) TaxID=482957 RepID=A0A6P2SJX3_BURL3|nr:type VI secretion system baseplate subunit TssG [Burkholderia lata]VWC49479.1 type VI secretion protein [Burkholderia lata]
MATDTGNAGRSVAERLFAEPQAFEFVQAVRLLEQLRPDAAALGTGLDPRREALLLCAPFTPVIASAELQALRRDALCSLSVESGSATHGDTPAQPELEVNLLGLGGLDGPLPDAYQEWLQHRVRLKDTSAVAFLNLFQHRLLALLYRAYRKHRIADPFVSPERGAIPTVLHGLAGLQPGARPTVGTDTELAPQAILGRAGLFANQRRSLAAFDVMVRHQFGALASSTPFDGGWRTLPEASRTRVGPRQGRNNLLGRGALAGTRIWDEHRGIRIDIGPLPLREYEAFLPGGRRHAELCSLAAAWFGANLLCRLDLTLAVGERPRALLSARAPQRLGWTAWLGGHHQPPSASITHVRLRSRGAGG